MDVGITGTGIFSMDAVHKILKASSLEEAKEIAKNSIAEIAKLGKKVRQENVKKAQVMVDKAKNAENIAFGMSNFILAFQGEKVIK